MNRTSLALALVASMVASVGCASKKYVKEQTTPIINKTNELDDLTAQNSKAIKDVDARAQAGIQDVNTRTAAADQKAQAAGQTAAQAQTLANNAVHRVDVLTDAVTNLVFRRLGEPVERPQYRWDAFLNPKPHRTDAVASGAEQAARTVTPKPTAKKPSSARGRSSSRTQGRDATP